MLNINFPKTSALAAWALSKAVVSFDTTEYEGDTYKITYRHFSGNVGKKLVSIGSELKTGSLYLINTELHQVFLEKTGKYASDFGKFRVCEVVYEKV
jgi:hypothetical protein